MESQPQFLLRLAQETILVDSSIADQLMDWLYALPGEQVESKVQVEPAEGLSRFCRCQAKWGDDVASVLEVWRQGHWRHSMMAAWQRGYRSW